MPITNALWIEESLIFSVNKLSHLEDSSSTSSSLSSSSKRTMKVIKSLKKLKFWSRKKRKRKSNFEPYHTNFYYHHPPPSTYHYPHCSYSNSSAQPSAPPLPPWLECEQAHDAVFAAESVHHGPDLSVPEIVVESTSVDPPMLPVSNSSSHSYQQYMVPNPVYGLPVVQTARRERFSGFFGCVIKFGANLIRCFCPCVRIREVYQEI